MNISISQTSPAYYTALLRYNKILDQRNSLLKNKDIYLVLDTLPVWDEQLAKYAAVIIKKRTEFLEKLSFDLHNAAFLRTHLRQRKGVSDDEKMDKYDFGADVVLHGAFDSPRV